jgi:hypothetical protein
MEPSDWLALAGIVSTLVIAVMTALLTERRERRQEKIKKDEQDRAHQFNIQAKQLELQYGRLHEKRVEAMAELFQQLESIRGKIDMIIHLGVNEGQNETKNLKKILKELDNSIVLFNKNKLYFSIDYRTQFVTRLNETGMGKDSFKKWSSKARPSRNKLQSQRSVR